MTDVKAKLRFLRIAPRKVRLVVGMVRGMKVKEAKAQLSFGSKKAALPILKLVNSAVNNAKHNFKLEPDDLYVKEIKVDEGPVLKRHMPRARGRAALIKKRTSHVSLVLSPVKQK